MFKWFLILLPKNLVSRLIGYLSHLTFPQFLIQWVIRLFAKSYQINTDEMIGEIRDYKSFQSFFIRKLKPEARTVDYREDSIVSPVDGAILQQGDIIDGQLIQVKGKSYSVYDLIPNQRQAQIFDGGRYITIYLSPSDYHRIHTATKAKVIGMEYTPGRLLPVNDFSIHHFDDVFSQNERLTTFFEHSKLGIYAMVKVGALNVGGIRVNYRAAFDTNLWRRKYFFYNLEEQSIHYEKSEEYSRFEFGSTIVLCFPKSKVDFYHSELPVKIQLGQPIARIIAD